MRYLFAPLGELTLHFAWVVGWAIVETLRLDESAEATAVGDYASDLLVRCVFLVFFYFGAALIGAVFHGARARERSRGACFAWGIVMGIATLLLEVPGQWALLFLTGGVLFQSAHQVTTAAKLPGFAVVYRWTLAPEAEERFTAAWKVVTKEFRATQGGLGSRLHRNVDGSWAAYACWPDQQAWERAELTTPAAQAASEAMNEVTTSRSEPILLVPTEDMLVGSASAPVLP
ncbi:MAG: antibiotic biosynthesis monooxygenase [Planctomycetota bacterium]